MRRYRGVILCVLALAPILATVLCAASGYERVTKPSKAVRVRERDELFGDMIESERMVRGPILGYYIGLDAVGVSAAGAVVLAALLLWATRARYRPVSDAPKRSEPPRGSNHAA